MYFLNKKRIISIILIHIAFIYFILDLCVSPKKITAAEKKVFSSEQPVNIPGTVDIGIRQPFPNIKDIISKPDPDLPVYGVFAWHNYFDDWWHFQDEVTKVGWKSVRIGCGYAGMISDKAMTNLAKSGVKVLAGLLGKSRGEFGAFNNNKNDRDFIKFYLSHIDKLIGRFGPNGSFFTENPTAPYNPIIYWEIWNEPNLHYLLGAKHWDKLDMSGKAELYAKLLVASYAHIRANPKWDKVKVIALSACGVSKNDIWAKNTPGHIGFIEMVHKAGNIDWDLDGRVDGNAAKSYDILSNHPYVHNSPPDSQCIPSQWYNYSIASSFRDYRNTMKRYGNKDKPVWFTEIGWHRENGIFPSTARRAVSERIQAAYVCRMYLTAIRLGVERVYIMFLMDADNFNGGFFNNKDRSWRESAIAVQNLIYLLPKPKIKGAISDGVDGYYAYIFNPNTDIKNSSPVITIWNVNGPLTVTIPCKPGKYSVIDNLGGSKVIRISSSQYSIDIGPCPVYLKMLK